MILEGKEYTMEKFLASLDDDQTEDVMAFCVDVQQLEAMQSTMFELLDGLINAQRSPGWRC